MLHVNLSIKWHKRMKKIVAKSFQEEATYVLLQDNIMIGTLELSSNFGEHFKGKKFFAKKSTLKSDKKSYENVSILRIPKKNYIRQPPHLIPLINAINILKSLKHTNIQSKYDIICKRNYVYIISNCVKKHTIASYLKLHEKEYFEEEKAIKYLKQLAKAAKYLQKHKIIHKNINFDSLYIDKKDNLHLGEFYFAEKNTQMSAIVAGPVSYMAYEMLTSDPNKPYIFDSKVDLWSIGIVFYKMLTGNFPFTGITKIAIIDSIKNNYDRKFDFPNSVSEQSRDLIQKLLNPKPEYRISWDSFFKHDVINKPIKNLLEKPKSCDLVSNRIFLKEIGDRSEFLRRLDNIDINLDLVKIKRKSNRHHFGLMSD